MTSSSFDDRSIESTDAPIALIDSCVLLDIATDDPQWSEWSANALAHARDEGVVVINPIIYAEVSVGYDRIEELEDALPAQDYMRESVPYQASFLAGKAYLAYRRRGGTKTAPLPDFFIGAHAAVKTYRLITRDVTRFRSYFPAVELISPE